MSRWWAAALLAVMSAVAGAGDAVAGWPKDTQRVVVRAFYEERAQLDAYRQQATPWAVYPRKQYLVVDVDASGYGDLEAAGFRVEIDSARTAELNTPRALDPQQRAGIPGFSCYRTVDETIATGAQLAADFPGLVTWSDQGDSWEKDAGFGGEDIYVLRLTNSAIGGAKPKLFVMSAIHAREYATAELNTRFGEYLLTRYGTDPDATWLLDYHEVHLLLQTNPDGRRKAQTGLLWRKNTNQNYCGATSNNRGADLNRNFEIAWGCCGGSSSNQCATDYRGPAPVSEPEAQAVTDYVRSIFADNRGPNPTDAAPLDTSGVFIDVHSFGELVLWPWGYTGTVPPNGPQMQTLGRRMAFFNGYLPAQATVLGITSGATDDFAYGDLGVPAYTFEIGTNFFQDCGSFENAIWPDNLQALIYAAKTARMPYVTAGGPDALEPALSDAAVAPGAPTQLSVLADDGRFDNSNGTEPVQSIAAVQYSIGTPPWDAAAVPVAMSATDGSFNTSSEAASAAVDTTGLGQGRHTVYVRAQDAGGTWGPVSAVFLFVIDPASAPRIAGRVVAADSGQGLAATVSAGNFSTTTDASGDYELLVIAGSYELTITPDDPNYGAQTGATFAVADFETVTQNAVVYPFCDLFADDMEAGPASWVAQGSWALTDAQSNSPSFSFTDSPGGNYADNVNAAITSLPIDLSDIGAVELQFASRCETEATYDFCIVEVSADGTSWSEIARYDGAQGGFADRSYLIESLAGSGAAQVRFRLATDVSITRDGWYVDDVRLRGAGAQCVSVADSDGDGVSDLLDNCTQAPNASQLDTNGDGYGNACDPDLNNDGIVNPIDLGLLRQAFFSVGQSDSDFNGDGVTNPVDLGVLRSYFFGPPGPSALAGP